MVTLSIDFAALLPVLLVMCLATCLGGVVYALGSLASGFGKLFLGIAEAVASGGQSSNRFGQTKRNKGVVFLRVLLYLAICIGAIVLSVSGYQFLAYVCALFGGGAFAIALLKLLK
jgi:hypothetical protein